MNRINTICIVFIFAALVTTVWRMDTRINMLEVQNAALLNAQYNTSMMLAQAVPPKPQPVDDGTTKGTERDIRTVYNSQINSRKFVQENVPSLGRVKYPLHEMITFIKLRNTSVSDNEAKHIVSSIIHAAEEFDVPATIVFALMSIESSFRRDAVSSKGAVGLMQINHKVWLNNAPDALPALAIAYTQKELFGIEANVRAGAYILAQYKQEAVRKGIRDSMGYALTRYLGGTQNDHPTNVRGEMGVFMAHLARPF